MHELSKWRFVGARVDGVRLTGKYLWRPMIQVFMKIPYDGIHVGLFERFPPEDVAEERARDVLVGVYGTCLRVLEHRDELRARLRAVTGAADLENATRRLFHVDDVLQRHSHVTSNQRERLLKPIVEVVDRQLHAKAEALRTAIEDLGFDYEHAFQVLDRLQPDFQLPAMLNRRRRTTPAA